MQTYTFPHTSFPFPLLSKGGSFFNKRAFILYRFENTSRYLEKEGKFSYFIQEGASRFRRIKVIEIEMRRIHRDVNAEAVVCYNIMDMTLTAVVAVTASTMIA
jgi:hypothetical protein